MAAGQFVPYQTNIDVVTFAALANANLRLALIKSTYIPDPSNVGDSQFSDVSADEIAAGFGYLAGGAALIGVVGTTIDGFKLTSGPASWSASGGDIPAWRYSVVYYFGTIAGIVNPLVAYCLGDATNIDVPPTTSGGSLTINCPADGWVDKTAP